MSKVLLEDELAHAAGTAPYDGQNTRDGEKVSHNEPQVPSPELVSTTAGLDSTAESMAHPKTAEPAGPQGIEAVKAAQGKADQPSTDCGPVAGVPTQVEDDSAIPSRAGTPAAPGVIQPGMAKLLQADSCSATSDRISATDGVSELDDTGSRSAEDEPGDSGSVSSDSTLDCTSTPVAIGQDPFATSTHALATQKGPEFQYCSLAKSLLHEDSR